MTRATYSKRIGYRVFWKGTRLVMEEEVSWVDGKGEVTKYGFLEETGPTDGTLYDSPEEAEKAFQDSGMGDPARYMEIEPVKLPKL